MALPILQKQAAEKRTATFDFTEKLQSGDALTGSATMTVETGLTAGSATRSGNVVTVQLSGGASGTTYRVDCRCSTTNGDILVISVLIEVRTNVN